ncbi:MAG: exodeoxyribonuclease V subunit alpha [Thermodesulfobacteriota bacterium]|nr:exodeoxyribonuclease V subunit alpha [Thermodesulfobacteriota bacterium]
MEGKLLSRLCEGGILSQLDVHFARFMARLAGTQAPELRLAAALASSHTRQGHICLNLASLAGNALLEKEDGKDPIACPTLRHWIEKLRGTIVVGTPGEFKPLILDDSARLYLHRYWDYEEKLACLILGRVREHEGDIDTARLKEGLGRLFGNASTSSPPGRTQPMDWQKIAAFTSLVNKFSVISGGPGTGKTTTVAKILALVLEQPNPKRVRIALVAPTGKAAARLQEAVVGATEELHCHDKIKEQIPEKASTIHRLLGSIPGSPYFRHHADNLLPLDLVVVDEASMVDLALMSKLVQALPPQARLVLLGDKDQLASVEAGAVLGDICDTGGGHTFSTPFKGYLKEVTGYDMGTERTEKDKPGISDCIVQLHRSFRFGSHSGIHGVSTAVNAGDGNLAADPVIAGQYQDVRWKHLPQPHVLPAAIRDAVINGYRDYLKAKDVEEVFHRFDRFRILCALRKGPYGVVALNVLAERILKDEGLIDPAGQWYAGRPVLITSNDYTLSLFNGDVGLALPDPVADNDLRVFFPAPGGTLRKIHPIRLPEHETVYAMTVHKSQGSEFDKLLLLLPDRDAPVLTRELLYTGITRAKEAVEIWATEAVFRTAVSRRIERTSGLRDALWEG